MLTLTLAWIGKIDDKEYADAVRRYVSRIERWARIDEIAVRAERERSGEAAIREGRKLLDRIPSRSRVMVLEAGGRMLTTQSFADLLVRHRDGDPRPLVFVVGGASGLPEAVRHRADEILSLSPMTFPHEIARLVLVEQIYRALSISAGLRYH
jgi:23S rRNA (pseudouridine1915-N3)-methyltransferase